jgi:hypothetical protein
MAALVLLASFAAHAQKPDHDNYDVRHVRWGMTQEEVIAAEGSSPEKRIPTAMTYKDTIAGVPARIFFLFTDGKLDQVSFDALPKSPRDDAELAFRTWDLALERKYGRGALVAGTEKKARGWAGDDKLEPALSEFKRGAIKKLSVFVTPKGRTDGISLTMESFPAGIAITMIFTARPADNF